MVIRFSLRRTQAGALLPISVYSYTDRLPSRNDGLAFSASIRYEWRRDLATWNRWSSPRAAARLIRTICEEVSGTATVLRVSAVEDEIAHRLRQGMPIVYEGIEIVQARVFLTVDQETINAAERLERLLHEYELDELARRQAKARADFLRDVMLSDPAAARLYAMLELPPRLGGPSGQTEVDDLVRRICEWHPQSRWVVIAQVLHDFVNGLSPNGRKDLLNIMQSAISTLGSREQALRLSNAAAMPDDLHSPASTESGELPL